MSRYVSRGLFMPIAKSKGANSLAAGGAVSCEQRPVTQTRTRINDHCLARLGG